MSSFVGIDVHQDKCHATVQNEEGETVKQGYFQNSPSGYSGFFNGIEDGTVAMEAGDAWQPIYDWLDEKGFEVKLAHPHKLRIIAEVKIKTDCRDSEALADLVRADLIPEVYVPCKHRRELRRTARQRGKLVQGRTKFKNRIKAELRRKGIEYNEGSLWTKNGKQWLKDLEINAVVDYLEVLGTLRPLLRWILYQCTHVHIQNGPESHIGKFYKRLVRKKPKNVGKIVVARKLLKTIYWMLKLKEEFHHEGYDSRKSC